MIKELERVLTQQIQNFVAKQAQYCETMFANDAAVLKAIREADSVNGILASQLDSSQMMSRNLLQRITGIIESPTTPRGASANASPSK